MILCIFKNVLFINIEVALIELIKSENFFVYRK